MGEETALFAADLYKMYTRFAKNCQSKKDTELEEIQEGVVRVRTKVDCWQLKRIYIQSH